MYDFKIEAADKATLYADLASGKFPASFVRPYPHGHER